MSATNKLELAMGDDRCAWTRWSFSKSDLKSFDNKNPMFQYLGNIDEPGKDAIVTHINGKTSDKDTIYLTVAFVRNTSEIRIQEWVPADSNGSYRGIAEPPVEIIRPAQSDCTSSTENKCSLFQSTGKGFQVTSEHLSGALAFGNQSGNNAPSDDQNGPSIK